MPQANQVQFLLTHERTIVKLTTAAQALLNTNLVLSARRERLDACDPSSRAVLADLLRAGGTRLGLLRGADSREFVALSVPVDGAGETPLWSLTLLAPDSRLDISPAARLYGLTPAETRLAGALINTGSQDGAIQELGISRNTVRVQMAAIYRKTATTRQGELIRVFTQIATIAQMCDAF